MFLENDEPAGAQRESELTESVDGFGLVHEHPPADGSIELVWFSGKRIEVAFDEADVWKAERVCALARHHERAGIPIHAYNLSGLAHQLCEHERDVATAAADIQHPHPGSDPGVDQQPLCHRIP